MVVGEIWRYPVKSMGGEQLEVTLLTPDGIPGDRVVHARDERQVVLHRRRCDPNVVIRYRRALGPKSSLCLRVLSCRIDVTW